MEPEGQYCPTQLQNTTCTPTCIHLAHLSPLWSSVDIRDVRSPLGRQTKHSRVFRAHLTKRKNPTFGEGEKPRFSSSPNLWICAKPPGQLQPDAWVHRQIRNCRYGLTRPRQAYRRTSARGTHKRAESGTPVSGERLVPATAVRHIQRNHSHPRLVAHAVSHGVHRRP